MSFGIAQDITMSLKFLVVHLMILSKFDDDRSPHSSDPDILILSIKNFAEATIYEVVSYLKTLH